MVHIQRYPYMAEDVSYYFPEHGRRVAVFVRCHCLRTKELVLLVSYHHYHV